MISREQVLRICLEQPAAFEDHPFGPEISVFRVRVPVAKTVSKAKVFALIWGQPGTVMLNLKCDPALAEQLRAGSDLITPGYHMNKKHWNTVTCGTGLELETLRELIEDSHDLVVATLPTKAQVALNSRRIANHG